jgi:hypothetical protein
MRTLNVDKRRKSQVQGEHTIKDPTGVKESKTLQRIQPGLVLQERSLPMISRRKGKM